MKDIMKLDQKKSLSDEEAEELLKKDIEEFKQSVRDEKLRNHDLKELYSLEKSGKERESFLNFLVRYGKEEKVLRELDGFLNQVSRIDSVLERIIEDDSQDIDVQEVNNKTVRELREYLKDSHLSKGELEEILEGEKEHKDRKTAKTYIKREINNSNSIISTSSIQEEVSDVEDKVRSFKKDFIYHPEIFDLENLEEEFDNHADDKDSGLGELVELTGKLVHNLKNSDNLAKTEELNQLVNDAILALESDNIEKFKEKIEELIGATDPKDEDGFEREVREQQSKLEEVENVINRLDSSQEKEEHNQSSEETSSDSAREELISALETKGFQKEELEQRSSDDLEKLDRSSESMDEVEEMFENTGEKEGEDESDSNNRIIRDIEKLEKTIQNSQ